MKPYLLFFFAIWPGLLFSQTTILNEEFEDGDFTNNPVWTGDISEFTVYDDSGNIMLRLNDTDASNSTTQLRTESTSAYGGWEFYVRMDFNPSSSNYVDVYLVSDQVDLQSDLNGYFIRIGGTTDEVSLFRQDGASSQKIIDGTDGTVSTNPVEVRVKVLRDNSGNWEFFIDPADTGSFESQGTVLDNDHTTSGYFGLVTNYTSTRSDLFYFDDFFVNIFRPTNAQAQSNQTIDLSFNFPVDEATLDNADFFLSDGLGSPQQTQLVNSDFTVRLDYGQDIPNGDYNLTVNNLDDTIGNSISSNTEIDFTFANPFKLTSVTSQQNDQALLTFSEDLDFSTVDVDDFTVNGEAINSSTSISQPESDQILLDFPEPLPSGSVEVEVSELESDKGWAIPEESSGQFFIYDDYQAGDIVINEFLKDPPTGTAEYVELRNTSDRYINLKDWEVGDNNTLTTVSDSDFTILPDSFTVISTDTSALFSYYGTANYAQASLPALNNGSDEIRVYDENGTLIDSLAYDSDWGGVDVAIERKDTSVVSAFRENWGDSPAADFGTPGQANQIQPDESAPEIEKLVIQDNQTLLLVVSERLVKSTAETTGNYSLSQNPESGASTPPLPSITGATQIAADTIRLDLDMELQEYDGSWTLKADNLTDIFGNTANATEEFNYYVIFMAEEHQVAINEFMYDPASGFSEFVELYNHSDSSFNLQNWTLNDNTGNRQSLTNSNRVLPKGKYVILAPDSSLAEFFPDASLIVMGSRFPALNNGTDAIVIRNQNGFQIDSLNYTSDWGGEEISLERRSVNFSATFSENWGDSPSSNSATAGAENEIKPDNTPPELLELGQISSNQIQLIFSERIQQGSSESLSNFTLSTDNISEIPNLQSATFSAPDTILLEFDTDLPSRPEGTTYELSISNQTDIFDNTAGDIIQSFFVIDYAEADSGDVFVTEFIFSPTEDFTDFIELYNPTETAFNLKDWTYNDNLGNPRVISDDEFSLLPNARVVLAPDSLIYEQFPDIIFIDMGNRFANLNSTTPDNIVIRNMEGILIDSLTYQPNWGGEETSLERRSITVSGIYRENWGNSTAEELATPGIENEVLPDNTPPSISDIQVLSNSQLRVLFSESIQYEPASTLQNFTLNTDAESIDPPELQSANLIATDTLLLDFDASFPREPDGTTYTLTTSNQTDVFGNMADMLSADFFIVDYARADSGEVFITEFMYDPPELFSEFIELYNATDSAFNLRGWTFNDNTGNRRVISDVDVSLNPGEHLIITPDSVIYENFPNTNFLAIGSRFSALNNSTDAIVIRDESGVLLDSLSYSSSWGGDEASLERRTIDFPPIYHENWGTSPSENSATPGLPNQIPEDETPPEIENLTVLNDSTLRVIFSERVQVGPATNPDNYSFSIPLNFDQPLPDLETIDFLQPDTVVLHYEIKIPREDDGSYLGLNIDNQDDIFGNVAEVLDVQFFLIDLSEPNPGDVVINEFMYDPAGMMTEFVELYNHTDRNFDLSGWLLNDNTGNRRVITDSNFELPTNSFVVLAPDSSLIEQFPTRNIIVMGSRFSSLNNSTDAIVISNADSVIIDSLSYSSDWGGEEVSLERLSPNAPSIYQENWSDSPSEDGSTPGRANQVQPDEAPPEVVRTTYASADSIRITFSERVDSILAHDLNSYSISPSISINEIANYSGNALYLVLNAELLDGTNYTVTISNQQDIFGNVMQTGDASFEYVLLSEARARDIIVNEILYRRASANSEEFIELYNRTDKNFDLSGWTFSDATGSANIPEGTQIRSGAYLVLTDSETADKESILRTKSISDRSQVIDGIYVPGFPSLNDDEDAIVIKNQDGMIIDSLFYDETWGGNEPGKSLERKDPESASNDASNWATNTSESGNSAGAQSTTYQPDETPPEVIFAKFQPNGKIFVAFSEFINIDATNVLVNKEPEVITVYNESDGNIVILGEDAFPSGEPLLVSFDRVSDFRGNSSEDLSVEVSQPLAPGNVVINEILFNPLANSDDNLPDQTEYIELYNHSDYAISLEGFYLHDEPDENNEVRDLHPVSSQFKWIAPNEYVVVYAEDQARNFSDSQLADYFEMENVEESNYIRIDRSSLSLANNDDAIYLSDSTGATIDSVFFDESWQNPNLYDTDGVALERIDPNGPSNDESNWSSSTRVNGGTPAEQNSIFQETGAGPEGTGISFSPNPFSPDDDGFDDNLFINYKLDEPDYLLRIRIFDRYGREVRQLADGKQAGFEGSLIWDGLTDDNRKNRVGIYIVLFEAYNSANGKNKTFKETVVLARKF